MTALLNRRSLLAACLLATQLRPASAADEALLARAAEMKALALRNGDQGFGALVARAGRVVAEAPSRVVTNRDPTAHAEMEALREAGRSLGGSLVGCALYSSFRPCPMCEAAAAWLGVDRLHHPDAPGGVAPRRAC